MTVGIRNRWLWSGIREVKSAGNWPKEKQRPDREGKQDQRAQTGARLPQDLTLDAKSQDRVGIWRSQQVKPTPESTPGSIFISFCPKVIKALDNGDPACLPSFSLAEDHRHLGHGRV